MFYDNSATILPPLRGFILDNIPYCICLHEVKVVVKTKLCKPNITFSNLVGGIIKKTYVTSTRFLFVVIPLFFMVGRRRIGKIRLLINAYKDTTCLYFFVSKKSESLLCEEFSEDM